jgi:hypothetical protein
MNSLLLQRILIADGVSCPSRSLVNDFWGGLIGENAKFLVRQDLACGRVQLLPGFGNLNVYS